MKTFFEQLHDNYVIVIGVITSALATVPSMVRVWQWFQKRAQAQNFSRWHNATVGQREIDRALRRIQSELEAQRVLLVASHNGGGFPKPGSPSYISVTGEVVDGTVPTISHRFNPFPVDAGYRDQVLVPLLSGGAVEVPTSKIVSGWLKDLQEAHGVYTLHARLISAEPKSLIFLVVHLTTPKEFTPAERNMLNEICEEIRGIVAAGSL
jgi:hypothetical protein